jgi:radical SAM superfamily enzyme YgiQ (UPF0313 family)
MEAAMRQSGLPLYSLETKHPVSEFDILGFSLPYETLYTNTLNLIDLAGIPLYAAKRQRDDPVVIAGGHAALNPEPMAAFFDAFVIGEGEEAVLEIARCVQSWKDSGQHEKNFTSSSPRSGAFMCPVYINLIIRTMGPSPGSNLSMKMRHSRS